MYANIRLNQQEGKFINAGDPAVLCFGQWEMKDGRCITHSAYNTICFHFTGKWVRFFARVGPDQSICDIYIDGDYAGTSDCSGDKNKITSVFEKNDIMGEKTHTIFVIARAREKAGTLICCLEAAGFETLNAINYPVELKQRKEREYTLISAKQKTWDPCGQWEAVPYKAKMPQKGVRLLPGMVRSVFDSNIRNIKACFAIPHYCEETTQGWIPPGKHWGTWLPAANDGRMLGGAAGVLRWEEDTELRTVIDVIIEKIKKQMREDGYFNYYDDVQYYTNTDRSDNWSERKNYDRVFWTRGMIAAALAGNDDAPVLLRRMYDWFNMQEQYLSVLLIGSNTTNSTPGGPLVYHSPIGKPEDIITNQRFLDQDYWFAAFAEKQPVAFSHYPGVKPHCYALLPVETAADEYRATGNAKYFDALTGAWDVFYRYYKHTGGAAAICECNGPYPPGSLYLSSHINGETCGSVFWMWINERLAQLYPREEKYIAQIEEVIYNVLCSCRDQAGSTRYHVRLHGKKDIGENVGTCCQTSSTIAISSIPQYIYMTDESGIYINLYAASTFESEFGSLTMETDFPNSGAVSVNVVPKAEAGRFTVNIRSPGWASDVVCVSVNGAFAGQAEPGGRVIVNREWKQGDKITFNVPFNPRLILYTGFDQSPDNLPRYTMMYGPLLMALDAAECKDASCIPHIRMDAKDLLPALIKSAENPLHFTIPGMNYTFIPYPEAEDEGFTCVPVIAYG
jgi:hypothetical protein